MLLICVASDLFVSLNSAFQKKMSWPTLILLCCCYVGADCAACVIGSALRGVPQPLLLYLIHMNGLHCYVQAVSLCNYSVVGKSHLVLLDI